MLNFNFMSCLYFALCVATPILNNKIEMSKGIRTNFRFFQILSVFIFVQPNYYCFSLCIHSCQVEEVLLCRIEQHEHIISRKHTHTPTLNMCNVQRYVLSMGNVQQIKYFLLLFLSFFLLLCKIAQHLRKFGAQQQLCTYLMFVFFVFIVFFSLRIFYRLFLLFFCCC